MNLPITYKYEVYDFDGYYKGLLEGVSNDFYYSQDINTAAVQIQIEVNLSVNRTAENVEPLYDESGDVITDESDEPIIIDRQPEYFEYMVQIRNRIIITEYSDYNVNGFVVFDGRISKWAVDEDNNKLIITCLSKGADFDQIILAGDDLVTIKEVNLSPEDMINSAFNVYTNTTKGGEINAFSSIVSGITGNYDFDFMSMLEVVQRSFSMLPKNFYWYVTVGNDPVFITQPALNIAQMSTTADHTFIQGRHINDMVVTKDLERVKNIVYFTGGLVSGNNLFRYYQNQQSVNLYGPRSEKLTDNRVTLNGTADIIADAFLDKYSEPNYTSQITINADTYNISNIEVGDTVGFAGFGNLIDGLILQIVRKTRASNYITLDLGLLPYRSMTSLEKFKRELRVLQTLDNPTAPS